MSKLKWQGTIPKNCEICRKKLGKEFVDGRTFVGYWAIMCGNCFKKYGVGLGLGKGQKYSLPGGQKIE